MSEGGTSRSAYRRQAAVLAAYLAQFERIDNGVSGNEPYVVGSAEEIAQRTHDHRMSVGLMEAFSFTDAQIEALTAARGRNGFSA